MPKYSLIAGLPSNIMKGLQHQKNFHDRYERQKCQEIMDTLKNLTPEKLTKLYNALKGKGKGKGVEAERKFWDQFGFSPTQRPLISMVRDAIKEKSSTIPPKKTATVSAQQADQIVGTIPTWAEISDALQTLSRTEKDRFSAATKNIMVTPPKEIQKTLAKLNAQAAQTMAAAKTSNGAKACTHG